MLCWVAAVICAKKCSLNTWEVDQINTTSPYMRGKQLYLSPTKSNVIRVGSTSINRRKIITTTEEWVIHFEPLNNSPFCCCCCLFAYHKLYQTFCVEKWKYMLHISINKDKHSSIRCVIISFSGLLFISFYLSMTSINIVVIATCHKPFAFP